MPLVSDSMRSLAHGLIVCGLLIVALIYGREILMPLALATLFAFILAPVISRATTIGVPRGVAAGLVVLVAMITLASLAFAFSAQLISLTADFSQYKENIVRKVRFVTGAQDGTSTLSRASATIDNLERDLKKEFASKNEAAPASDTGAPPQQPQVIIAKEEHQGVFSALDKFAKFVAPMTAAGLTVLFTIFLLVQYHDLRDRVVRIAGTDNISVTSAALSDAGARLSHLFTMQAALNIGFGMFVGAALWAIGVPNPLLWAMATAVLRFVPYIGSLIAAIPPTVLAAGVDPGWTMTFATLAVFGIGEPIVGHLIEPTVLGRSAGVSPLAFILAASFWTLLWGPVGLILAAPITLLLVVLGQYIPRLEVISVLLGDEPVLSAEEEFYHRLLAGDAPAALEQLDSAANSSQLAAAGDSVVLPALRLAARDLRAQIIDDHQVQKIKATIDDVLDLLDAPEVDGNSKTSSGQPIIVIPARGEIDQLAARFMARALQASTEDKVITIDKSSGLMALTTAISHTGGSAPRLVVLATVGGIDAPYLKLIEDRAKRGFPASRLLTYSLAIATRKSGGDGAVVSTTTLRDIASLVGSKSSSEPSDARVVADAAAA